MAFAKSYYLDDRQVLFDEERDAIRHLALALDAFAAEAERRGDQRGQRVGYEDGLRDGFERGVRAAADEAYACCRSRILELTLPPTPKEPT